MEISTQKFSATNIKSVKGNFLYDIPRKMVLIIDAGPKQIATMVKKFLVFCSCIKGSKTVPTKAIKAINPYRKSTKPDFLQAFFRRYVLKSIFASGCNSYKLFDTLCLVKFTYFSWLLSKLVFFSSRSWILKEISFRFEN